MRVLAPNMADASRYLTPAAILIAGGGIAVAVYFGLSAKGPAPSSSAPPSAATTAVPGGLETTAKITTSTPVASPVDRTPPPASSASMADVTARVTKEVEKQRPLLLEKCWRPSVAKAAEPKRWKATLQFGFGPTGNQVARGIMEDRQFVRTDVTQCVTDNLLAIDAGPAAAGAQNVLVPIELP